VRTCGAAVEPIPQRVAQDAVIEKNGFRVVRLIRERNEQGLGWLGGQLRQVNFVTRSPTTRACDAPANGSRIAIDWSHAEVSVLGYEITDCFWLSALPNAYSAN
jgi:hypothetical protein